MSHFWGFWPFYFVFVFFWFFFVRPDCRTCLHQILTKTRFWPLYNRCPKGWAHMLLLLLLLSHTHTSSLIKQMCLNLLALLTWLTLWVHSPHVASHKSIYGQFLLMSSLLLSLVLSTRRYTQKWYLVSLTPWAKSHMCSTGPHPSHASFTAWSFCPHLCGNSFPLGTNVTILGQNYKYSSWHYFHYSQVNWWS